MNGRIVERAIAAATMLALLLVWNAAERRAGAAEADVKRLTREGKALAAAANVARVVYVRDTVTLARTVARWRTIVAAVDTQWLHDSIAVPGPIVREVVAAGDSAVRACSVVVSSCSRALAADSLVIANRDARIRALERSRPGLVRRWGERLAWGAIGYAIGRASP